MAIEKTHELLNAFEGLWNTPSNVLEKNVGRLVEIECGEPNSDAHRISVYRITGTQFNYNKQIVYRGVEVSTTYFNDYNHYGYRAFEPVLLNTFIAGVSYECSDEFGKPINPSDILKWV